MVKQIYKIVLCLIVLIPLIISADDTIVDEKKIKLTEKTESFNIVERDEIQRIANKTDESISQLKERIMRLESQVDELKGEIEYLKKRVSDLE